MLRSLWGKVRKKKSSGEASRAKAEFGEGKGVHHCSYVLSCQHVLGRNRDMQANQVVRSIVVVAA